MARPPKGFTLIELILVMALLAIAAGFVGPRMVSFYQGRTLTIEAQRLLSLTHYARSRAITEALPMTLSLDQTNAGYTLEIQAGFASEDEKAVGYAVDSTLSMSVEASTTTRTSYASYGSNLSALSGNSSTTARNASLPQILFTPDGRIDESSPERIVLRHENGSALQVCLNEARLAYEILPWSDTDAR